MISALLPVFGNGLPPFFYMKDIRFTNVLKGVLSKQQKHDYMHINYN